MSDESSFHISVLVPVSQSIVTGIFIGLACYGFFKPADTSNFASSISLGFGSLGALIAWIILIRNWKDLVWHVQTGGVAFEEGSDDEYEYVPTPTTRLDITDNSGRNQSFPELPVSQKQLTTLIAGVVDGAPFTEAYWVEAKRTFRRSEFVQLRTTLLKLGWVEARGATADRGYGLTAQGNRIFGAYAGTLDTHAHTRVDKSDYYSPNPALG